jgi:hypothetical protein
MINQLKQIVIENADRIAKLGGWPGYVSPDSLGSRVPEEGGRSQGFDAGVACALDLIPREKQKLAATLHASYTPEAVEQVRREVTYGDDRFSRTETYWWLIACSFCTH